MAETLALPDALLASFSTFLAHHIGLHFPPKRWPELLRGIGAVSREFGFEDSAACMQWLMTAPPNRGRIEILAAHLTIGETYFFRDPQLFEVLQTHILPPLIQARRQSEKRLRIWSAGCSSGEEAYSIAILLQRMLPDYRQWNMTILATDINPYALRKAEQGLYGEWSFRNAPPWLLHDYFAAAGKAQYRLNPDVRNMVTFRYLNLAQDDYPSLATNTATLDMILCRNVLLYFEPELAAKAVRQYCRALLDGGWLIVSPTELSQTSSAELETVHFPGAILLRKKSPGTTCSLDKEAPTLSRFNAIHDIDTALKSSGYKRNARPAVVSKKLTLQPPPAYDLALALYRQGRYGEAAEQAMQLLSERQDPVRASKLLVRIYTNQGQLDKARQYCEHIIATDRLNPAGYFLLALVLLEQDQAEPAVQALKRALFLDQAFVPAYFTLANLYRQQGRPTLAAKHFANAEALLNGYAPEDVLPESDGITAGRLMQIIRSLNSRGKAS